MKARINFMCSVLALFCFVSMFVPVIAPRYPAGQYYAAEGNNDYYYTGDYYLARRYWSITDYVFSSDSPILGRLVLSIDQALLLLWAIMSVRGEAGKKGVWVALFNLAVVGVTVGLMLRVMWACRWGLLAVMALDMIASVILSANA